MWHPRHSHHFQVQSSLNIEITGGVSQCRTTALEFHVAATILSSQSVRSFEGKISSPLPDFFPTSFLFGLLTSLEMFSAALLSRFPFYCPLIGGLTSGLCAEITIPVRLPSTAVLHLTAPASSCLSLAARKINRLLSLPCSQLP